MVGLLRVEGSILHFHFVDISHELHLSFHQHAELLFNHLLTFNHLPFQHVNLLLCLADFFLDLLDSRNEFLILFDVSFGGCRVEFEFVADSMGGLFVLVETEEFVEMGVIEVGEDGGEEGDVGGELLLGRVDFEVLGGEQMGVA